MLFVYIRNITALWDYMLNFKKDGFVKRATYSWLSLYLASDIIAGVAGVSMLIWFLWTHRQDLEDLFIVIRFKPGDDSQSSDVELQRLNPPPSTRPLPPPSSPVPGRVPAPIAPPPRRRPHSLPNSRSLHSPPLDQVTSPLHRSPLLLLPSPSPLPSPLDTPADFPPIELTRLNHGASITAIYPQNTRRDQRTHRESGLQNFPHFISGNSFRSTEGDERQTARASRRSFDNNGPPSLSVDTSDEQLSLIPDTESEDRTAFHNAPRRSRRSRSHNNMDEVGEEEGRTSCSHCSTCSESHTSTIPHTRAASVREPLTPTSPSGERGSLSAVNPSVVTTLLSNSAFLPDEGGQERLGSRLFSLLADIEAIITQQRRDQVSETSNESNAGDSPQDAMERYEFETARPGESIALASMNLTPRSIAEEGVPTPASGGSERSLQSQRAKKINNEGTVIDTSRDLNKEVSQERAIHRALTQNYRPSISINRGQAITAALALQRGIPTTASPPHQPSPESCPTPTPAPAPSIPSYPTVSTSAPQPSNPSTAPSQTSSTRSHRVMGDPRLVNLADEERPNIMRVLSPRLRVQTLARARDGVQDRVDDDEEHDENGGDADEEEDHRDEDADDEDEGEDQDQDQNHDNEEEVDVNTNEGEPFVREQEEGDREDSRYDDIEQNH